MRSEIRPAEPHEVAAFFAGDKTQYDMLKIGEHVVAMGGFTEHEGRLWAFLNVKPHETTPRTLLVRGLRRALERRGGTISVTCMQDAYATAPRLLRLLGFQPTGEIWHDGREVWIWQN